VAELVSIADALAAVLARVRPLEPERVSLADAHGRVLLEPARAVTDLPPFPSSAMDGYAVRAADTPGMLTIVAHTLAGRPTSTVLGPGQAIGVTTGGVVPDGADAVVPVENVVHEENSIEIGSAVTSGAHVRGRGGDVSAGDVVVPAGARVGAAHLGALAASGVTELVCSRRPLVRVLTTGSELRRAGEPLGPGEIYESNGTMLAALLAEAGAAVETLPPVEDEAAAHRQAIVRGLEADVLVTSGGVSVGSHDLVREVEAELGVEEVFWGVAMRPGKPLSFGVHGRSLVFGLPGNPVSTLVGALLFVRPALLALQGAAVPGPPWASGVLGARARRAPARDDLVRSRSHLTENGIVLTPVSGQESHMIVRAATADALVHVPRGEGELEVGTPVRYLRLD
jgi:molybdopterin molybdotransferase